MLFVGDMVEGGGAHTGKAEGARREMGSINGCHFVLFAGS